jgi:hypothetical protein
MFAKQCVKLATRKTLAEIELELNRSIERDD